MALNKLYSRDLCHAETCACVGLCSFQPRPSTNLELLSVTMSLKYNLNKTQTTSVLFLTVQKHECQKVLQSAVSLSATRGWLQNGLGPIRLNTCCHQLSFLLTNRILSLSNILLMNTQKLVFINIKIFTRKHYKSTEESGLGFDVFR